MRRPLLYLCLLLYFPLLATSAFPPPFESVMYAQYESTYYDQQAAAWEALATSACGTDDAWWQYYKTAQYSNRFGNGDHDLDAILAAAEKACDPNGFDLQYIRFAHERDPEERYAHLLRAVAADSSRIEASTGLSGYYTVRGMEEKRHELLRRMHAKRPLPAGLVEYNYNQLQSVGENGILITHGDADTFPSWLLQSAYGVRKDVLVVNLYLLLGFPSYQEHIRELLGVEKLFAAPTRDAKSLMDQLAEYERPVHVAATGRAQLTDIPAERLYLTGLTFRYSKTPINNLG
ncbi:MAG: hypothetical protein AAFN92_21950, partial [Bacteroidota bacterium]